MEVIDFFIPYNDGGKQTYDPPDGLLQLQRMMESRGSCNSRGVTCALPTLKVSKIELTFLIFRLNSYWRVIRWQSSFLQYSIIAIQLSLINTRRTYGQLLLPWLIMFLLSKQFKIKNVIPIKTYVLVRIYYELKS